MSAYDCVILAVVAICVAGAVLFMVRRRPNGCCGDCPGCTQSCARRRKKD